jgi:hypothetical protein
MFIGKISYCAGVALVALTLAFGLAATPASAGQTPLLLAQQGPMGMPPGQQQGGNRQQPQGQAGGNANNSCMQSYQRCVMMCAGVANCINNCNVGYAVCTNPQGARPRGQ